MRLGRVYLATIRHGTSEFVLKEIPQDFETCSDIYRRLEGSPHIRALCDKVSESRIFVFEYLNQNLLHLAQKRLPIVQTKKILKDALRGLAALHEQDIVHNDIKPNNIVLQANEIDTGFYVHNVQIADLEDAIHLPRDKMLVGRARGNWMWRSPESHVEGPRYRESDMFSFGIVCIYAILRHVIFAVDEGEVLEDMDKRNSVLRLQVSYFAEADTFVKFLDYIGAENPWHKVLLDMLKTFVPGQPKEPFRLWKMENIDNDFKDLVGRMTSFDPLGRITAEQALSHEWFSEV